MSQSIQDIDFSQAEDITKLEEILKEKLGITFAECGTILSQSLQDRAAVLSEDIINIAPYSDYDKLLEKKEDILKFLQDEASKIENWEIHFVELKKDKKQEKDGLLELMFHNKAVDDGDMLRGYVFIGLSGKIRHAFVQMAV